MLFLIVFLGAEVWRKSLKFYHRALKLIMVPLNKLHEPMDHLWTAEDDAPNAEVRRKPLTF